MLRDLIPQSRWSEHVTAFDAAWQRAVPESHARTTSMPWLDGLAGSATSLHIDAEGVVHVGDQAAAVGAQRDALVDALAKLRPWRKGPFSVCGVEIDAEWRSEAKWDRVSHLLPDLTGSVVCDVGCNNGYYMFRLAALGAEAVLGVDPQLLYVRQFELLNSIARVPRLAIAPLGVEALAQTPGVFDCVVCMGLLYHVTDPLTTLRTLAGAMAKGGTLLLETIVVDGDDPVAYVPESRYAGAKGFHFVPTLPCLLAWIRRANLRVVEQGDIVATTPDEQRATAWRQGASLAEGLDPDDPARTIEGLPAPKRVALLLRR